MSEQRPFNGRDSLFQKYIDEGYLTNDSTSVCYMQSRAKNSDYSKIVMDKTVNIYKHIKILYGIIFLLILLILLGILSVNQEMKSLSRDRSVLTRENRLIDKRNSSLDSVNSDLDILWTYFLQSFDDHDQLRRKRSKNGLRRSKRDEQIVSLLTNSLVSNIISYMYIILMQIRKFMKIIFNKRYALLIIMSNEIFYKI